MKIKKNNWLIQWHREPEKFIRASVRLIGVSDLMKEIDSYLNNPFERLKARSFIN